MRFAEQARAAIQQQVRRGMVTGAGLARIARVAQPQLCAFLGGRRGLSVAALERVLAAAGLAVLLVPAGPPPQYPVGPRSPERK